MQEYVKRIFARYIFTVSFEERTILPITFAIDLIDSKSTSILGYSDKNHLSRSKRNQ